MMRNSRNALIATTVLCTFAVATYACGGDDDNASIPNSSSSSSSTSGSLSSTSSSSGTSGTSSSSSSGTSGSTTSSASSSSGTSGSTSGQTPADAGEVGDASEIPDSGGKIPDSGTTFDGAAGTLCQLGSVQEQEVNDTAGAANTIPGKTGTFCGSLSSSTDKDFVQFTLPADAVTLDISNQTSNTGFQLSGTVTVGNSTQTFALNGADAGAFPFVPGGVYTLEATSTAAAAIDYIIGITITEQAPVSLCKGDSIKEIEPNDTDGNATPITLQNGAATWCGAIASPSDVDEFSFVMPSGFSKLSTNFATSGTGLTVAITDNGTPVADPTKITINAGHTYIYKFTANASNDAYLYTFTLSN